MVLYIKVPNLYSSVDQSGKSIQSYTSRCQIFAGFDKLQRTMEPNKVSMDSYDIYGYNYCFADEEMKKAHKMLRPKTW